MASNVAGGQGGRVEPARRLPVHPARGLKVILDQFGQGGEGQWEVVLAASVVATLPMLVIFFLGQRYLVEGIATTGRKG
jgi:ABC-type glycerol-3-phosphate transport system permease component